MIRVGDKVRIIDAATQVGTVIGRFEDYHLGTGSMVCRVLFKDGSYEYQTMVFESALERAE